MTTRAQELFDRLVRGGEAALDDMIADRASEELFLDFKGSPDNGSGTKLHQADRAKLAKAISGFGNSEGGVLVWGIDCENLPSDGDVAKSKRPLKNPARFKSWLEAAVSGCTLPPHQSVEHRVIPAAANHSEGFLVTLIPKSVRSPHQCIVEPNRHRYYMRVGSNFEHVPHGVLAGLFGQAPQPRVILKWKNYGGGLSDSDRGLIGSNAIPKNAPFSNVGLLLKNAGICVARDLYVNIIALSPGPNCPIVVSPTGNNVQFQPWQYHSPFSNVHQCVSDDSYKLAPGAIAEPVILTFLLAPPFESKFQVHITYGATGTPVSEVSYTLSAHQMGQLYGEFMKSDSKEDAGYALAESLLPIPELGNE